jgi:hypothetical protein
VPHRRKIRLGRKKDKIPGDPDPEIPDFRRVRNSAGGQGRHTVAHDASSLKHYCYPLLFQSICTAGGSALVAVTQRHEHEPASQSIITFSGATRGCALRIGMWQSHATSRCTRCTSLSTPHPRPSSGMASVEANLHLWLALPSKSIWAGVCRAVPTSLLAKESLEQ